LNLRAQRRAWGWHPFIDEFSVAISETELAIVGVLSVAAVGVFEVQQIRREL
jgi:hypothetical protein